MSKNSLNDWSTTPADNTDIAGTNINIGCPPQDVGTYMRTAMAQIAYAVQGSGGAIPANWYVGQLLVEANNANAAIVLNSSGGSGKSWELVSNTSGTFTIYDATDGVGPFSFYSAGNLAITSSTSNPSVTLTNTAPGGRSWAVTSDTGGGFDIYDATAAATRFSVDANGYITITGGKSVTFSNSASYANASYILASAFSATVGLAVTHSIAAGTLIADSDGRLKTDLVTLLPEDGAAFVRATTPRAYRKHETADHLDDGRQETGFVAQEVLAAGYAHLVSGRPDAGMPDGIRLGLEYDQCTAYLVAALRFAFAEIDAMKTRIAELEAVG